MSVVDITEFLILEIGGELGRRVVSGGAVPWHGCKGMMLEFLCGRQSFTSNYCLRYPPILKLVRELITALDP
jgi:hypothetical protein